MPARPPIRSEFCGHCGYNVRGLPDLICPECGSHLSQVGVRVAAVDKRSSLLLWQLAWLAACFVLWAGILDPIQARYGLLHRRYTSDQFVNFSLIPATITPVRMHLSTTGADNISKIQLRTRPLRRELQIKFGGDNTAFIRLYSDSKTATLFLPNSDVRSGLPLNPSSLALLYKSTYPDIRTIADHNLVFAEAWNCVHEEIGLEPLAMSSAPAWSNDYSFGARRFISINASLRSATGGQFVSPLNNLAAILVSVAGWAFGAHALRRMHHRWKYRKQLFFPPSQPASQPAGRPDAVTA